MKTGKSDRAARFDPKVLRDLAGDKVFARGVAYHRDRLVHLLAVEPVRVLARVAGAEDYRVELRGTGAAIDGECCCPAFSQFGFCKHMVATALAANEAAASGRLEEENPLEAIRRHLRAQTPEALVALVVDLAERDPALWRRLHLAATADAAADDTLFARFRDAIDEACHTRDFIDYREAASWAGEIDEVLDRIADLVDKGRAEVVLRLIDHFLPALAEAQNSVDDSDGCVGELFERARDIHFEACRAARPDPRTLAAWLFAHEMGDDLDTFHGAATAYADLLGEVGLAEYRRLATEAWDALPPVPAGRPSFSDSASWRCRRLMSILDGFAERDGDADLRIALRTKDLSSPWHYLQLAEFCLEHGRDGEALRWAEEGLWIHEDSYDERLAVFTAELYVRVARYEDADALLWKCFERSPNLELYQRLVAQKDAAAREAARGRAVALLRARLPSSGNSTGWTWSHPADLLVRLFLHEHMFDEAWAAVNAHGVSEGLRETLAEASEGSHPQEALATYARRIDIQVSHGGQKNYEDSVRLLGRMRAIRGRLGQLTEHAAYLTRLEVQYRAKRNFMKMLKALNPATGAAEGS